MRSFCQIVAMSLVLFQQNTAFQMFENKAVGEVNKMEKDEKTCTTPLDCVKSRFNDLFSNDYLSQWIPPVSTLVPHNMMMDIKETEKSYDLIIDLPGVEKKDISILVDGNDLTITAERSARKDSEGDNYKRTERFSGRITRTIHLPDTIDQKSTKAESANGVLNLVMPKVNEGFRQAREIEVK